MKGGDLGGGGMIPGTEQWLDMWVGHARPGARQMIGPVELTHQVPSDLGRRCQDLAAAGLIVAVWKRPQGLRGPWEWHLHRTTLPLPPIWPQVKRPTVTLRAISASQASAAIKVLKAIERAARSGEPAPTNEEIAGLLGAASVRSGANMIAMLEQAGKIRVDRYIRSRVIHLVGLGISTADQGGSRTPARGGRAA
jgi:hypothetical protein